MDQRRFESLLRSVAATTSRRQTVRRLVGAGLGVAVPGSSWHVQASERVTAEACPERRVCGDKCCRLGQACRNKQCVCPEGACGRATDPTDDQFEECFCDTAVGGKAFCMANISCTPEPPSCTKNKDCEKGFVCQALSCGAQPRCVPVCKVR